MPQADEVPVVPAANPFPDVVCQVSMVGLPPPFWGGKDTFAEDEEGHPVRLRIPISVDRVHHIGEETGPIGAGCLGDVGDGVDVGAHGFLKAG